MLKAQLAKGIWDFALRRRILEVESLPTNEFGFDYRSGVPADCIRIVQVNDYWEQSPFYHTLKTPPYAVEWGYILSNDDTINLRYISDDFDIRNASSFFIEAFVAALAVEMCRRLTASNTLMQTVSALYNERFNQALYANAIQAPHKKEMCSWLAVRYT